MPDKLTPQKKRRIGRHPTPEQKVQEQETFLQAFAASGNVSAACQVAGRSRTTIYEWLEHDEVFSLRYNMAQKDVDDAIRAEIYRRGMFGEERYVVSQGKIVYDPEGKPLTIREKSDTLLIFHAKARMPEYKDKQQIEHSGPGGGPIQVQRNPNLRNLSDEDLEMLEAMARKAARGTDAPNA